MIQGFFRVILFSILFSGIITPAIYSQEKRPLLTDFSIPDTVCVNEPVTVTNLSQGTSTYYWAFCKGDLMTNPQGMNTGNPNNTLIKPYYICLVEDGTDYYSFITNKADGSITRIRHGASLLQTPLAAQNLGNFARLDSNLNGIQVLKSGNNWYGFAVENNNLFRLDFGNSIQNTPTLLSIGVLITPMHKLNGLQILEDAGSYYGFCTDATDNSLWRFSWGASLTSVPAIYNFGNVAGFNKPAQLAMRYQDPNWCMVVCNEGDNSISQLTFGTQITNLPTGSNIGTFGSLAGNRGLSLVDECNNVNVGFVLNHNTTTMPLARLDLNGGACASLSVAALFNPNPAGLDHPSIFSNWTRIGDTVYAIATNTGNSTISVIYFPDCTAATLPFSTLKNPPAYSYTTPGTYTVLLITDRGTIAEGQQCKEITVLPGPAVNLGNDTTACTGQTVVLDAGPGYSSYLWSTGATSQTIGVKQNGSYWVKATVASGCQASDTVRVTFAPAITYALDTLVCYGVPYFAGGSWQTTAGIYLDTLHTSGGCDSILTTTLSYKQKIPVDLGADQYICPGDQVVMHGTYVPTAGAAYLWQDSSTDSVFVATAPGTYWVRVTVDSCSAADTVRLTDCPSELWFPNAFSPNEDGHNDVFRPKGLSISKYHLEIYDRWGAMVFQTDELDQGWNGVYKGEYCPAGVYVYYATFEGTDNPGKTNIRKGTFTLLR